jgi:hypothetical protein
VVKLGEALANTKGHNEFLAAQEEAHGLMQQGVSIMGLRRKALDQDVVSVKEWSDAFKKYGSSNKEMMAAIAEGKEGPELQALFKSLQVETKALADAAEAAKAKTVPAINEVGDTAAIAAAELTKLKSEMGLTFGSDIQAEISKVERALVVFRNELSPDAAEKLQKRLVELKAQLPKTFTGIDAMASPVNTTIQSISESVYGATLGLGLLSETTVTATGDVEAGLQQAAAAAKAFDDEMKSLAGPTVADVERQIAAIDEVVRKYGTDLGPTAQRVKELREEQERLRDSITEPTAWDEFVTAASTAMDKVKAVTSQVFGAITSVVQQSQKNKEIAIENEYKKRLAVINATIKDETKKAAAIQALEAEFQIKRTAAQAAAAKTSKAVALMDAVVNTADAVTKALTAGPIIGPILAGIIGAMGAVQIALIAKQPIPLAKGAVFNRPTLLPARDFQVAEAGEQEWVLPDSKLKAAFADAVRSLVPQMALALAPAGGGGAITVNINSPLVQTTGLSNADVEAAGPAIWRSVERSLRARGRS